VAKTESPSPGIINQSTRSTVRRVIFITGVCLWLGSMLVQTRLDGIIALWTGALLLGGLFIVTTPTRTVTIGQLIQPLCLGGAMLGLAILAGAILNSAIGPSAGRLREVTIPLAEEVIKILPLLWILWRERNGRAQTLGVTDLLLIAAACGVGFGLVEEAFIRHNEGWSRPLWWLPTSEIIRRPDGGTQLIVGHGAWTGLAGLTLGFALLLRRPRMLMTFVGISGLVWAAIDHAGTNYGHSHRDALGAILRFINGDGWVTAYLFLVGVIAAIYLDFYLLHFSHRKLPEATLPRPGLSLDQLRSLWAFELVRRQFAFAVARYQRESGITRVRAAVLAANLDGTLVNWQQWWRETSKPSKAAV